MNLTLKLKQSVVETPVINGFSWAFLHLLTNKAQEMRDGGKLFTENALNPGWADLHSESIAILNHICVQLQLGPTWGSYEKIAKIDDLLCTAHNFLDIFVDQKLLRK